MQAGFMARERSLAAARRALDAGGPRSLLEYLNEGIAHRFSAIYRFDGATLRLVLLHDQEGRVSGYEPASPLGHSFCPFVLPTCARGGLGEAVRGVFYHAVPVQSRTPNALWGTLSHFDRLPRRLSAPEFELLESAGRLLAKPS